VSHCLAVGTTGTTDTNGRAVVLQMTNVSSWSSTPVPHSVSVLKAVTCLSASWCTAVGGNAVGNAVVLTFH